jgi:hypothetical protein
MSQEELRSSTEENLKWLGALVATLPDLAFIEPTVQAMAIINKNSKFSNDELIMIGVAGFIATKARIVDEERFQTITPGEYIHHAYVLLKLSKSEEPTEAEYLSTMQNLYK